MIIFNEQEMIIGFSFLIESYYSFFLLNVLLYILQVYKE